MQIIVTLRVIAMCLLAAVILTGCSSKPVLMSKDSGIPAGIDLSGFWTLRESPGSDTKADRVMPARRFGLFDRSSQRARRVNPRHHGAPAGRDAGSASEPAAYCVAIGNWRRSSYPR